MDCQMPKMDGFEAACAIRSEEAIRGWIPVPIVALTALTMASERERCLAVGMNAHLLKPFGTGELARTIWDVLPVNHLWQIIRRAS
jgi:CheY-like chemotaxis protein